VLDVAEVRRPGTGSRAERLPRELFSAPRAVVDAFLDAYVAEAGHRRRDGCVAVVTGSRRLALGIAWLVLKTGRLPRIRVKRRQRVGNMQGRTVSVAPKMYSIEWFEDAVRRGFFRHDERYVYVPLRRISTCLYDGFVYNLDVADDHSYLAQLVGTHNCQNWLTSQALRDPVAGVAPEPVTAAPLADLAVRHRARILTSTYNEPLITSE
jgi:intein/homing endonuclease